MEIGALDFKNLIYKKKTEVEKAISGDKEAFCALIRDNKISLYKVAKGMLYKEEDVEDAISNCILNAYKNINKLKKEEYFKTWLIRILINECNNILRKNKNVEYIEDYECVKNDFYKDEYKDVDLHKAINSLKENLKEVIILYYYDDISQSDIAKILDINEATVRTRLFRAKEKLREILKENFEKDSL